MNFFNDRGIAGRFGGDNIGEVVFFTSRLTDAERQQVEMYLMQKWEGTCQPSETVVRLASGTAVEFDDNGSSAVKVRGAGTVEKTASGTQYYGDANQGVSDAAWHLGNGGMTFEKGEARLLLGSGEALTSAKDAYGMTTVSRTTDVEAGAAAITGGSGAYRLESIPSSASNLTLTCGTLSIGSKADAVDGVKVPTTDAAVYATMPNPGFEKYSGQKWSNAAWTEADWSYTHDSGAGAWFILKQGMGNWSTYTPNTPVPEGDYCMGFQFGSSSGVGVQAVASTTVSFPRDGDYLLTFRDAPRHPSWDGSNPRVCNYDAYAHSLVEMALVDANAVKKDVCRFYSEGVYQKNQYRYDRYLVRDVKAGQYTFTITFTHTLSGEKFTFLDDFKFRLVESEKTETVYPVPNGDFEKHTYPNVTTFDTSVTAENWTFTNPELASGAMAAVGPMRNSISSSVGANYVDSYMELSWFMNARDEYGQCQLAFFGNGGVAQTAAFTPPAGKWRLRCRVAHATSGMLKWNDAVINGQGNFTVSLSKNGGAEASLGTIYVTGAEFVSSTFPTAFSCNGTDSVVLKLRQTNASGNVRVDDLELVRDDNLVADGGFNDSVISGKTGAWTTSCWTEMPNYSQYYGKTVLDGRALLLGRQGYAYQTVNFADAGTYRLSFWARGRAHYVNADDALPLMNYAQNRVRFTLEKDSAVREIYRSEKLNSTNFVHYTALFKVETAGGYTFRLQGTDTEDHNAWIDNVRIDKVSAAQAPELPENATIKVQLGEGEKLRLDYPGTATVRSLKVNGKNLHEEVSEATYPDYVTGPGKIYVTYRSGLFILVK